MFAAALQWHRFLQGALGFRRLQACLALWFRAPIVVTVLLGIVLSCTATFFVWQSEHRTAQQEFEAIAASYFMALQEGVNEYLGKLKAVRALFDASDDKVTRREFESFARPFINPGSAIQTLSWVPRIRHADRAAHERDGRADGLPDYQIKIASEHGLTAAPDQPEYYPIFYATVPRTSRLYGLDLRSEPPTLAELEAARDGDLLGFSEIPALVSASGQQHGFIFSLPVYQAGPPHGTLEERRRNLFGFVHGSLVTGQMIESILSAATTPRGVDLMFFRADAGKGQRPLYAHGSRLRTEPLMVRPLSASTDDGLRWTRDILAGNEPWLTLVIEPMPGGALLPRHDRAWLVLLSGLLVTGFVVLYMKSSVGHAEQLLRANAEISKLALRDSLTGLFNRRAFNEALAAAFSTSRRNGRPFAVLYFDLDQFKDVNDTLGHPIGDLLLRQVAERVQGAVRRSDIVARCGGDEFAILQRESSEASTMLLASRINTLVAQIFDIDGNDVHVTASIGISQYSENAQSPDALIMQADLALYRAKEDGRNNYRFHSAAFDREVLERVSIAEDLRGAVERGEMCLHYQPQVELGSGRFIGVEALLRWNHPKRGLLAPSKFVQVAERTGSIGALGEWVIDEACRQMRMWADLGVSPGVVAVNVSGSQFKAGYDMENFVRSVVSKWDIAPTALEIELTESILMEVTQQHSKSLERLREFGVKIAIDDFGTGYSSLNYLTNFPISRLKIAQELVFGVCAELRNATVVRAAIRLADELGIECLAEGVESAEQASFLIEAGCRLAQGFYFSKPLSAESMTALLAEKPARMGRPKPPLKLVS
jgi:diguanylate cyclase (GGDEF)-like protein